MIFGLLAGAAALAECHERDSLQGHRVRANSWKSFRFRIWKLECANSSVSNSMNKLRHLESSSPPRCWDIFVHGGSLWWKWAISETWPGWDCQWVANLPTRPIWPTWPIQPILAYSAYSCWKKELSLWQRLCSDALRSLDVFCEKEITQTFVGYQGCTKDLLRIYQG